MTQTANTGITLSVIRLGFFALLALFFLADFRAQGQTAPFSITALEADYAQLGNYIKVLTDSTGNISPEDVIAGKYEAKFIDHANIPERLDHNFAHWGAITFVNTLERDIDFVLFIGQNNYVDVYVERPDGSFALKKAGFFDAIAEKDLPKGRESKVSLFMRHNDTTKVYYRILSTTHFRPRINISLKPERAWHEDIEWRNLFQGAFTGILGIMVLYNCLLFIQSRDRTYLFYFLYILAGLTYWTSYSGFARELFITEWVMPWQVLWVLAIALSPAFYILFMRDFLNTPVLLPKWDKVFLWAVWIMLAGLAVQLSIFFATFNLAFVSEISIMQTLASYGFLLFCLFLIGRTRNTLAYYFLVGSMALWIGVFVGTALLQIVHKGEGNSFAPWSQAGLVAEVLLFSLGLGYRMRRTEEDKRKAQEGLIEQLKANEEMQQRANRELEAKVKQRTLEIEKQKEEIQAQRDNIGVAYEEISLQKILVEKKNQDITASINYAKRIQSAILPPEGRIQKALSPESFVIFQPRDIVSGDFYWFSDKMKNGRKIIAAVDCTGHGVPGAIMSMIGNDLLNEAIHLKGLSDPAEILQDMSVNVRERLRQEDATSIRDSMDMGICIIDHKKVTFAGAKLPLFYIQNGQFNEIKADKHPIGGDTTKGDLSFITHEVPLVESPTHFYLLSDGYQDQFGGSENRKFMKGRVKMLLQAIYALPAEAQKQRMEEEMRNWQGGYKQIDDIMVLGFRL